MGYLSSRYLLEAEEGDAIVSRRRLMECTLPNHGCHTPGAHLLEPCTTHTTWLSNLLRVLFCPPQVSHAIVLTSVML